MDDTISSKFVGSIFQYGRGQSDWKASEACGKFQAKPIPKNAIEIFSIPLQIPNHFFWLCFFYITFHSFLNLVGELLHFADRNFYCDWWNATNIDTFWRTWNMPVHRWCIRHVYIPIVDLGYSRLTASLVVFFISAFFHEYLVRFALTIRLFFSFDMKLQLIRILLTLTI